MLEFIVIYLTCFVTTTILFAIRDPYESTRAVTILSLIWPITLLLVLLVQVFDLFGIQFNFDANKNGKWFNIRRGTNPLCYGFAVTVFKIEFQFYKVKIKRN